MGVAELVLDCLGSKVALSSLLQDGRRLELSLGIISAIISSFSPLPIQLSCHGGPRMGNSLSALGPDLLPSFLLRRGPLPDGEVS